MNWKEYPQEKPETDINCLVGNNRYSRETYEAIYWKNRDCFVLYNPQIASHPPLDVTHWIELPVIPELVK